MASGRRLSLRIGKSRVEMTPKVPGTTGDAPHDTPEVEPETQVVEVEQSEELRTDIEGNKRLGEMLVDEGIISAAQLDKAIATQQEKGGFLGRVLVELGFCAEDQITSCLAKQCHIPYYNLSEYNLDEEVLGLIPSVICRKYKVIPVDRLGNILTVAVLAPLDTGSVEAAQAACPKLKVKPILCSYEQFITIMDRIEQRNSEGGAKSITLDSLGVSAMHEAPPPPSAHTSAYLKPSFPPALTPKQGDSGLFDTGELVAMIQASMQKAVDDMSAVVAKSQSVQSKGANAGAETTAEILAAFKAEVEAGNRRLLEEIFAKADASETQAPPAPQLDVQGLGDTLSARIRDVLESQALQLQPTQAQPTQTPEDVADLNSIARGIQKEISTVMEEMMNAFSSQLRPVMTLLKADDKFERHEAFVKSIYDNIREALSTNHKDALTQQAHVLGVLQEMQSALQNTDDSKVAFGELNAKLEGLSSISEGLSEIRAQLMELPATGRECVQALDQNTERHRPEDDNVAEALGRNIDPKPFSFENYHASEAGQEAVNWCKFVAEKPGGGLAPLYLHGSPGTGKTHLLCAMVNTMRQKQPDLRIGYMNSAEFAAGHLDALQRGGVEIFHTQLSQWDVLILEDIQGLAHRPDLQHELLQLLYVYTRSKRQLVLSATEALNEIDGMDMRVQSHLSACISARVAAPNWQQRMAILRRENELINAPLNEELLGLIAMNIPGNIRHLIGALHRARAFAQQRGITLSGEHADELIRHISQG